MGFSRPQAEDALMKSGGDPDLAAEQLMTQVCVRVFFLFREHDLLPFFVFFWPPQNHCGRSQYFPDPSNQPPIRCRGTPPSIEPLQRLITPMPPLVLIKKPLPYT